MKILYFGDSHIASLMNAARVHPIDVKHKEVFFGAAKPHLEDNSFLFTDSTMTPTNEKIKNTFYQTAGKEKIDFSEYDACVLVSWFAQSMQIFRLIERNKTYLPISIYSEDFKNHLISMQVYNNYLLQGVRYAETLTNNIREIFKGPIFIVQRPFHAESSPYNFTSRKNIDKKIITTIVNDYWHLNTSYLSKNNITFIPQPTETLGDKFFTKTLYTTDSLKLMDGKPHPNSDHAHMNTEYGKIVLKKIREKLLRQ